MKPIRWVEEGRQGRFCPSCARNYSLLTTQAHNPVSVVRRPANLVLGLYARELLTAHLACAEPISATNNPPVVACSVVTFHSNFPV
jgi:hypothetical protein